MHYYIDVLKNYAKFEGRATRKEYWMFVLINAAVGFIVSILTTLTGISFLPALYSLAIFIPTLAIGSQRLHDVDKSGKWLLISLVPIIGWIWILVLLCGESTPGINKYGKNSQEVQV